MNNNKNKWYKLDNAAKIFPAISSSNNTATYRVAFILNESIKPNLLQSALDKVIQRFPTLAVKVRKGLFWYFLENNENKLEIKKESNYPCHEIDPDSNNGYLLKVMYFNCRISVEIQHTLTDGSGAIEFLKTLTYEYLCLLNLDVQHDGLILLPEDIPSKYETEDSFQKYYQPCDVSGFKEEAAYHIEGTLFQPLGNNVIHGVISASKLNSIAKGKGATITEYIIALLIYSIYNETIKYGKYPQPIKIAIPINLRKMFPSRTLRNFFSVVNIGIKFEKEVEFDYILKEVISQLRDKTKKEKLYPRIASNIKSEKVLLTKFIPLWIKNIVLRYVYNNTGTKMKTCTVSNLGRVVLPNSMSKYVKRMDVVFYPSKGNPINCGVCSINDKLTITFSRIIINPSIIRHFFTSLTNESGIDVDISSNDWGQINEQV